MVTLLALFVCCGGLLLSPPPLAQLLLKLGVVVASLVKVYAIDNHESSTDACNDAQRGFGRYHLVDIGSVTLVFISHCRPADEALSLDD